MSERMAGSHLLLTPCVPRRRPWHWAPGQVQVDEEREGQAAPRGALPAASELGRAAASSLWRTLAA